MCDCVSEQSPLLNEGGFCCVNKFCANISANKMIAIVFVCLQVDVDKDSGQTILSGMGELHLDIVRSRIANEYSVDVDLGPLQIAYK